MRNRSQDKGTPKLLMEFNRNEEVPKLVSLHEVSRTKDVRNRLLQQARTNIPPYKKKIEPNEMTYQQQNQEAERQENEELRAAIRQLNFESQKLREVNQGLIMRIKQVETSYRNLRNDLEHQQEEDRRRLKNSLYADVEQYIKMTVERLTLNLKQQRMTPSLQNKLQRFLAQLMEINSVSVQQIVKKSRLEPSALKVEPSNYPAESRTSTVGRLLSDYKTKKQEFPSRQHYASIMQRLVGEGPMSKSYAGAGLAYGTSGSQDTRIRTVYATTPSKRRRIFE